jgi:hypothetical protein
VIKVVSIDPGITTGFAIGKIEDGSMKVDADEQRWNHLALYNWLEHMQPEHIVCERFEFRRLRQEGLELFSRELIGVVNLYTQQHKIHLYMQTPSEAIGGYYNNEKLRSSKVYRTGKPHANDALRHLLHWFTFKQGYQFNEKGFN